MDEEVGEGISQAVSQTPSQLDQYCVVVPAKLRLVSLAACLKHLCFVSPSLFVQSKPMYVCVQCRHNITYVRTRLNSMEVYVLFVEGCLLGLRYCACSVGFEEEGDCVHDQ